MHIKRLVLILAGVMIILVLYALVWGNSALQLTRITYSAPGLPDSMRGTRLLHLSDIHSAASGKSGERLLNACREAQPDLIVITGDLVTDSQDIPSALALSEKLTEIAPVYYVTGNHEASLAYNDLKKLMNGLDELHVNVLDNESVYYSKNGEHITLIGLRDPGLDPQPAWADKQANVKNTLCTLCRNTDGFTLVLSHRPELIDQYAAAGPCLVLCGHAHGGQVRLPLIGGLYAPGQGLFPRYTAGLYTKGDTDMIVSRGIGSVTFLPRIGNRPELVLITLQ